MPGRGRGCAGDAQGPRQKAPDLGGGGGQRAEGSLAEALTSGLTPGQRDRFPGTPLPLLPISKAPGPQEHSLHGWAWGALSVPMAFLVSLGQKSSSGVYGTGVKSRGSVLISLLDQWCHSPAVGSERWEVGAGRPSLLKSLLGEVKSIYQNRETRVRNPSAFADSQPFMLHLHFLPPMLNYFKVNPRHTINL